MENAAYKPRYVGHGRTQVFYDLPSGWGFWGLNPGHPAVVSPLRFPKFGVWRPEFNDVRARRDIIKYSPIKWSLFQVMIEYV